MILRRALLRDVRDRAGQFAAVVITVMLGVALFGASYDAYQNLNASYNGLYDRLAFADLTARGGPQDAVEAAVGEVPGVAAVTRRTVAETPLEVGGRRLVGRLVGMSPGTQPAVNRVLVLRGQDLDPAQPGGVLVEQHLANHYGLEAGDRVETLALDGWRTLEVLGIVASPEYLWPARSRQEILVSPADFGVLFVPSALVESLPASVRQVETLVRLAPDAPATALDEVRSAAIAAGAADVVDRAEQASNAALQEDVRGFGEIAVAFPLLFLGAAGLALSVLLGRLVASQRPQIGTLRAAGFRRRTILAHYIAFGLIVGLAGSLPGALIGALAATGISELYTSVISVPITIIEVRPETIAAGILFGPLAGALAALGPARRAAATSPAAAMGGFAPAATGGRSLLERAVPPLGRLPIRWLAAMRGLGRNRVRSLSTIIGVALAATLVLAGWGMVDTVTILLDRQFNQVTQQDAELYLAGPLPADQAVALATVPGVAASEPVIELPVAIGSEGDRYGTSLVGLVQGTTMHRFLAPDGSTIALPADGILLGAALRDRLDVAIGDEVAVLPATAIDGAGTAGGRLRVAGFVSEPLGTLAYASLDTVAAIRDGGAPSAEPGPAVSGVLVRFEPGADRSALRDRLSAAPGIAAYVDSRTLYDTAQSFMGLFYAFVGVMLAFGGVMAFALIYNTLSANVAERAPELAALRTLGMRRRTLGWLVTSENLVLTLIGLVPGLVGGYLFAALFMASFSSDLFQFDLQVTPLTFVGTAAAILVAALASHVPALRTIGRLDLASIARQRAL